MESPPTYIIIMIPVDDVLSSLPEFSDRNHPLQGVRSRALNNSHNRTTKESFATELKAIIKECRTIWGQQGRKLHIALGSPQPVGDDLKSVVVETWIGCYVDLS